MGRQTLKCFIFIKVYKTKSTKDISLYMFLIFTIGVLSWLIYGLIINDWPVILANAVTLILSFFILIYKQLFYCCIYGITLIGMGPFITVNLSFFSVYFF